MTRLYKCEGTQQRSEKNGEPFRCDRNKDACLHDSFFLPRLHEGFFLALHGGSRMSKRKLDTSAPLAQQYQHLCAEVPKLSGELARQVLEVLHAGEESTGKRAAHRAKHAYPAALPALRQIPIHATSAEKQIYVMSLPQLIQSKVNSCALFRSSLEWAIKKKGPSLELLLFWDEAVPGNVLSPDLQRKSALTYVTFKLISLRPSWTLLGSLYPWFERKICKTFLKGMQSRWRLSWSRSRKTPKMASWLKLIKNRTCFSCVAFHLCQMQTEFVCALAAKEPRAWNAVSNAPMCLAVSVAMWQSINISVRTNFICSKGKRHKVCVIFWRICLVWLSNRSKKKLKPCWVGIL